MTKTVSFDDVYVMPTGLVIACPTDTVYGLSCAVTDMSAIAKIQQLKSRGENSEKHLIVLIGSVDDLQMFGIVPTEGQLHVLSQVWPGPVSIIFSGISDTWNHLSSDGTLACRLPQHPDLSKWIQRVGPIISTSANMKGKSPATTTKEVLLQFPEGIDICIEGGVCDASPSTLIKFLR